ncbi:MAG: hypothetical protein GOMPHAMPRED_006210 [Gomphillus americanus]|uniref:Uncharacterized protein n=1 Tax=Gomphillus americanus TaxID=1940652 RepID=A0A8H3ICJ7_9LECA|nr:MAG: hypothetical protein GOMPHAMPRED_006210 [Gomphillus americanus]
MPKSTLKMPSRKPDLKALSSLPSPSPTLPRKRRPPAQSSEYIADNNLSIDHKPNKHSKHNDNKTRPKSSPGYGCGSEPKAPSKPLDIPRVSSSPLSAAADSAESAEPAEPAGKTAPLLPIPQVKPTLDISPRAKGKGKPPTTTEFKAEVQKQKSDALDVLGRELQQARAHLAEQNRLIRDVLEETCISTPTGEAGSNSHEAAAETETGTRTTPTEATATVTTTAAAAAAAAAATKLTQCHALLSGYHTFCARQQNNTQRKASKSGLLDEAEEGENDDADDVLFAASLLDDQAKAAVERETANFRAEMRGWFFEGNDGSSSSGGGGDIGAAARFLGIAREGEDDELLKDGQQEEVRFGGDAVSWAQAEGVLGQVVRRLVRLK